MFFRVQKKKTVAVSYYYWKTISKVLTVCRGRGFVFQINFAISRRAFTITTCSAVISDKSRKNSKFRSVELLKFIRPGEEKKKKNMMNTIIKCLRANTQMQTFSLPVYVYRNVNKFLLL